MTAPEQPDDLSTNPLLGVPSEPDPSIAPGAPDPADGEGKAPAAPADRWVRFDGALAQSVFHIGEWVPGDVKYVAGWLAERLLGRADFVEVDAPDSAPAMEVAAPAETAPEPEAPKARRGKTADTDSASPVDA
jgi:hypothetical protein